VPLSPEFKNVLMAYRAACCGVVITRPARWFVSMGQFRCRSCGAMSRLTYDAKLKLFEQAERALTSKRE
jgi:hypothetical protein